jgi:hypothetical protein
MSPPQSSIQRFSSRAGRLSHVFLKDRLAGAKSYRRIAGYFRSSIFELVEEEIAGIDSIEIVCNSDLDPRDITASRLARETAIKEKWNESFDEIDTLMNRKRYQRLTAWRFSSSRFAVAIPLAKLKQIRCCIMDCMNPADFTRLRIASVKSFAAA